MGCVYVDRNIILSKLMDGHRRPFNIALENLNKHKNVSFLSSLMPSQKHADIDTRASRDGRSDT